MSAPTVGDKFPEDIVFSYVRPTDSEITACGIPIDYEASKEWSNKTVVLFSVPGAFTPGCSARHLPPYIEKLSELKAKGVDLVVCIASNDAFVMDAWRKANGVKDDSILFLSDTDCKFSAKYGWTMLPAAGRTSRYAMLIKDGKIVYAEKEPAREISVSGVDAILAQL